MVSSLKKELITWTTIIKLNTHLANIASLPKSGPIGKLLDVMAKTVEIQEWLWTLALSYGSSRRRKKMLYKQDNIKVKNNIISPEKWRKPLLINHLYSTILPDVRFVDSTSGEHRISNFYFWQIAYAEIVFYWLYFAGIFRSNIMEAIKNYQNRERKICEKLANNST